MAKLKKQKQPQNPGKETMSLFLQYSVTILCVLLVTILPLAMKNGFYQIGDFKFQVYKVIMIGGIALITPMLLLYAFFCRQEFHLKDCIKSLSVTDWFVLAYMILTLISYFANPKYMKDNFWGYPGWYMGLFAQFTFVFLYFVISRFGTDYKIILAFLAGTSFITYVLGILNRLLIDPLGVYKGLDPKYYNFISTLGQHTWYSSFLCTFLPFMMGIYMVGKKKWLHVVCGIFCVTGFTTLVSQNADSAYFAMLGVFLILLCIAERNATLMRYYVELVLFFFLSAKLMRLLLLIKPNEYMFVDGTDTKLDQISMFLIFDNRSWALIILVVIAWIIFFSLEKKEKYSQSVVRVLRYVLYGVVAAAILVAVSILILGAKGKLSEAMMEKVSGIPYLVWSDVWGNARGFTWKISWRILTELKPLKMLLGVGPDGFPRYSYEFYQDIIRAGWGDNVLTNAHNEVMTTLINAGILGSVAYFGTFFSCMAKGLKKDNHCIICVAAVPVVMSYLFHNFFCYQQVLCTPILFLVIAIAESELRGYKQTIDKSEKSHIKV